MATNMMEILKQIQQDQKEYMRNINDKLNVMDGKIVDLDKKINQQQVLVTIKRLEQLVRQNNMLLFGNDETENNIEDKTAMSYKPELDAVKTDLSGQTEKHIDNPEARGLQNSMNSALIEDIERNCKTGSDKLEDLTFTETRDDDLKIIAPIGEATACVVCKHGDVKISPMCINTDRINQIDNKLDRIANIYQSDISKIKELLKDIAETSNDSITETEKLETDNTVSLCNELKHIADKIQEDSQDTVESMNTFVTAVKMLTGDVTTIIHKDTEQISIIETNIQSLMREMRGLIKDYAARKMPEEPVSKVWEQKTVQISPAYFSASQIGRLNTELKRIGEMYYATNIFPIIEVVLGAGDEHPIMKQLRKGVYYEENNISDDSVMIKVKLGANGFKRSDVIDLVTDYPNLSFNEVIEEWLKTLPKTRQDEGKKYDFTTPMIYNKNRNLVRLTL